MKTRSKLLAALAAVILTASAARGAEVTGHHVLSNGLDVRLFHEPSTPLVATLVLVKTGYALEDPTNLGYSHLMEHLIFAGTEEMDKEELFRRVEEMGGYLNGYTRDDYMGYLMVGHRDDFPRQMELLSQILFEAAIGETSVSEAKEVVLEEIRRRGSRPGTRSNEMFQSLLYEGSTYARTGLGNIRTVSEVSREELIAHYRSVYRPNNMILLAAGGIGGKEALAVLEETFGIPPAGKLPDRPGPPKPLLGRRVYSLETDIPDLKVQVGFNGPDPRSEDAQSLELLAGVLGGSAGRLKKALEREGFEPRAVGARLAINDGFSRFIISADFPAGTDGEEALGAILGEVGRVAESGADSIEVLAARDALKAGEIMGREKLHYYLMGKADWVLAGAPGQGLSEKRWEGLFTADQKLAAEKYLAGRDYVALLAMPAAAAREEGSPEGASRVRKMLENGIVVLAEERPGSEVFALNILTRSRSAAEPPGKAGIADFLHRMLTRGTGEKSKEEIAAELRGLGISLSTAGNPTVPFGDFYTSRHFSFIRMECLREKADKAVDLVAGLVRAASFPPEEVEEVRGEMVDFIAWGKGRPGSIAGRILAGSLYGPGPLGSDVLGTEESIGSIATADLASFRDRYFSGGNMIVSVVSGLPAEEAASLAAAAFASLPASDGVTPVVLERTTADSLVEEELGKPQGALAAGAVTGSATPGESAVLALVTGLLNDRLSRELREREGLAYSVGGSLGEVDGQAVFSLSMGTAPEKMEQARRGIRREIEAVRGASVTEDELRRRVNALAGRLQMRTLSSLNRGFYLALGERNGLAHSYGEDYRQILLAITPGQVEEAARRWLPEHLVEVVVR
jgi:zinc protease